MDRSLFISTLFKNEYPALIRKAYRLTGSKELAEDLLQDTFLLALAHFEELAVHPSPGGWLTLTLFNLVRNERRRSRCYSELPLEKADLLQGKEELPPLDDFLPLQLPTDDRNILIWRFEQQLDYREIAMRLGISESACRMRVCRLLKKCRNILSNTEF